MPAPPVTGTPGSNPGWLHGRAGWGRVALTDYLVSDQVPGERIASPPAQAGVTAWTSAYLRRARFVDYFCALAAGLLAFTPRFGGAGQGSLAVFCLTAGLT